MTSSLHSQWANYLEAVAGSVECLGVELCEPCLHLQSLTRPGVIKGLAHRGGLNADILNDGDIAVGDSITVEE